MYAKIPEAIREPLLKELKAVRLRSAIRNYPAVVLIFSALATLIVVVKGHALIELLRDIIPSEFSDGMLMTAGLAIIVAATTAVLWIFLRQEYRDCAYQECLYCRKCDGIDRYDYGSCPICEAPLVQKETFFYTTYKDEQKVLKRWGLEASRASKI